MFGDGRVGDLVVNTGEIKYTDDVRTHLTQNAPAGQNTLVVGDTTGFAIGDRVLVMQVIGVPSGEYELARVAGVSGLTITLQNTLSNTYEVEGSATLYQEVGFSGVSATFTA